MATLEFKPNPGLTREQIKSVLEYFGAFHFDKNNEDGTHYDMSTAVSLSELPNQTREEIISHYLEDYELDLTDEDVLEECELIVRESKKIVVDMVNEEYLYQDNGYYTYLLNRVDGGNIHYVDAPAGYKTSSFLNLEKGLQKIAWVEIAD